MDLGSAFLKKSRKKHKWYVYVGLAVVLLMAAWCVWQMVQASVMPKDTPDEAAAQVKAEAAETQKQNLAALTANVLKLTDGQVAPLSELAPFEFDAMAYAWGIGSDSAVFNLVGDAFASPRGVTNNDIMSFAFLKDGDVVCYALCAAQDTMGWILCAEPELSRAFSSTTALLTNDRAHMLRAVVGADGVRLHYAQ